MKFSFYPILIIYFQLIVLCCCYSARPVAEFNGAMFGLKVHMDGYYTPTAGEIYCNSTDKCVEAFCKMNNRTSVSAVGIIVYDCLEGETNSSVWNVDLGALKTNIVHNKIVYEVNPIFPFVRAHNQTQFFNTICRLYQNKNFWVFFASPIELC